MAEDTNNTITPVEYDLREEGRVLAELIKSTSTALGIIDSTNSQSKSEVADDLAAMVRRARTIMCPKQ